MAVAAIGLAAGFAASRFLKASSRTRYTQAAGYEAAGWERPRPIEPRRTGAVVPTHAGEAVRPARTGSREEARA